MHFNLLFFEVSHTPGFFNAIALTTWPLLYKLKLDLYSKRNWWNI